jgi:hypothetical protein
MSIRIGASVRNSSRRAARNKHDLWLIDGAKGTALIRLLLLALVALATAACTLVQAVPPPTAAPFSVQFQTPENGAQFTEGATVSVLVYAQDQTGPGIARIDLLVDDVLTQQGAPVESSAVPAFTVETNWTAQGVGLHALTAVAYRSDGSAAPPVSIRIEVVAPP